MNNYVTIGISVIVAIIAVLEAPVVHRMFDSLSDDVVNIMMKNGEKYANNVRIVRDEYGTPHIFGDTNADTTFGLAYAHAEDDFTVIQQVIMAGRGQLAAVYGQKYAPNDFMNQLFRVQKFVGDKYDTDLDEATRDIAESYAQGLNYYAARHQKEIISSLLFPIRGRDIAAAFVHKIPLFFRLEMTLGQLMSDNVNTTQLRRFPIDLAAGGSNTVAVSPTRTADKSTMLTVNSHQPWDGPASWYEVHVQSRQGWDLTGALLPGSPFPQLGHNERLGWAFTVNRPDVVDVYNLRVNEDHSKYWFDNGWRDFEVVSAPIRVRLWGPLYWTFVQQLQYTVHGPVIKGKHGSYAVRYSTWGSIKYIEQGYKTAVSTTFEEWKSAMSMEGRVPMFNANYADHNGTIFYVWNAMIPKRNPKFNWLDVLPGDDPLALWDEYEPFERLPQWHNPSSGFTQNCNNNPLHTTVPPKEPSEFPRTFGIEPEMSNRALRYLQLLEADKSITFNKFIEYKWDLYYHQDSFVMKQVRRLMKWRDEHQDAVSPLLRKAIDHLSSWSGSTHESDMHAALGVAAIEPFIDILLIVIGPYPSDAIATDIQPLLRSLNESTTLLMENFGRLDVEYGVVNRLQRGTVDVPMGGGPDIIHAVHRKRVSDTSPIHKGWAGDGALQVIQWLPNGTCVAYTAHQYGAAQGRPNSKHYNDQVQMMASRKMRRVYYNFDDIPNKERVYSPSQ